MRAAALAVWLAASPAPAAQPPALPDQPVSRNAPGWSLQGRSLLLYGPEGDLTDEIGLVKEETATTTREIRGGRSSGGHAAWTLERKLHWKPGRTKLLESRRLLKVYGSSAQPIWTDDAPDWPDNGEPLVFSEDGRVALVARRLGEAWAVEARDWTGVSILTAGPFPRLDSIALAPAGRFATVRWSVPDKSDTHTFLDLKTKRRQDVDTSELTLGLARLGDDGVARSGRREVLRFEVDAPTGPAATAPAASSSSEAGPRAPAAEPR